MHVISAEPISIETQPPSSNLIKTADVRMLAAYQKYLIQAYSSIQ